MKLKFVDIQENGIPWDDILTQVRQGTEVILKEGDEAVARLSPIDPKRHRPVPGLHKGQYGISDDFDDPLPDEFWLGKERTLGLHPGAFETVGDFDAPLPDEFWLGVS